MEETQIFFKGNPVTSNNYIPKSALYNRKTKNYIVEMPEGENYFPAPRKRQFSQLHYQS